MRDLVVNADDFGLTPGVSDGILRCHEHGIVTSTSVLVVAPAFAGRVGALRSSGLPAGVHLSLVGEDPPLLGGAEIPTLVDRRGRFPLSWRSFVRAAARGSVDPGDVRRELTAQLDAATTEGITPTHLDTHQNLHLWPSVGEVVTGLAVERGIPAIRVTRTRRWGPLGLGVRSLSAWARRKAERQGLVVPASATGLDHAGAMDAARLRSELALLTRGTGPVDVTVHPGADPDPDRARYDWGYSWPAELDALCDPELARWVRATGFRLVSYRELAPA